MNTWTVTFITRSGHTMTKTCTEEIEAGRFASQVISAGATGVRIATTAQAEVDLIGGAI